MAAPDPRRRSESDVWLRYYQLVAHQLCQGGQVTDEETAELARACARQAVPPGQLASAHRLAMEQSGVHSRVLRSIELLEAALNNYHSPAVSRRGGPPRLPVGREPAEGPPYQRFLSPEEFAPWLRKIAAAGAQTGRPLSLLVVDPDRFTLYNRRQGYEKGDRALRRIGGLIVGNLRSHDQVGRYPGHFAVLLPETDLRGALAVAERIRLAVAKARFLAGPITVSAGAASLPEDTRTARGLVERARQACQLAKQLGGNLTCAPI